MLTCGLVVCSAVSTLTAQEAANAAPSQDLDFPALIRETQQSANEAGYAGLVWWIPTEYWEISAERAGFREDKAKSRYAALRKYTVVAVAVGKIGVGNINWTSEPDLRENIRLKDSDGNVYFPVQKLSGDAEGLETVIKPVFANILGPMGQNIQMFFFSATNKMAKPIADPFAPGGFSVILSKVLNGKEKTFEWKLPLTSLSPAKYCPVGKERVQANWKYCPWHGVKLDDSAPAAESPVK